MTHYCFVSWQRSQYVDGAKIQSQLSSSSLELTVIQEAAPVVDNEDEEDYY